MIYFSIPLSSIGLLLGLRGTLSLADLAEEALRNILCVCVVSKRYFCKF